MAKILFAAGIEEVSGALSKIKTKSMHRDDGNMFLATHRKAATTSLHCQRAYYRKVNNLPWQQGNAVKADTLSLRSKFAEAGKAIRLRRKDLMAISGDQAAFLVLRDQLKAETGYGGTMNLFYWAAAKKYRVQGGSTVTWPEGAIALTYDEYYTAWANNKRAQK